MTHFQEQFSLANIVTKAVQDIKYNENKINRLPTTSGTRCGFLPVLERFLCSTLGCTRLLTGCTAESEIWPAPGDPTLRYTFWLFLENYRLHNCENGKM